MNATWCEVLSTDGEKTNKNNENAQRTRKAGAEIFFNNLNIVY